MKRHIVAVALAVSAAPALALEIGAPYDQSQVDRQLPNIEFPVVAPYVADARSPYDQLAVDRAVPNLPAQRSVQYAAAAGSTRSDAEISTEGAVNLTSGSGLATGPWANDYHFIAPAQ
ncbi:MAG TPA: hypothetical protein VHG88_13405 [Burkholderiales bacterium]|nr:hypothetical protein [Burkholderiales bacterium]